MRVTVGEIGLTIDSRLTRATYDVGPEAAMDVWSRVLVWRTGRVLRRANRQRREALRRELASYTPRDLVDLEAAIDRYPLGQTHELRSMLAEQRAGWTWTHLHGAA